MSRGGVRGIDPLGVKPEPAQPPARRAGHRRPRARRGGRHHRVDAVPVRRRRGVRRAGDLLRGDRDAAPRSGPSRLRRCRGGARRRRAPAHPRRSVVVGHRARRGRPLPEPTRPLDRDHACTVDVDTSQPRCTWPARSPTSTTTPAAIASGGGGDVGRRGAHRSCSRSTPCSPANSAASTDGRAGRPRHRAATCEVTDVTGPLPFGVDVD